MRCIELRDAGVPGLVEALVQRLHRLAVEAFEKRLHRAHHVRMRVEGAAREADVGRAVFAKALHPARTPAHHADRQATGHCLAIGHEVGLHAEVLLCAARREAKADEHLVEDQRDAALGAHRAQLAQPARVAIAIEVRATAAVEQGRVAGRGGVGMQRLQRVDQHARDVAARAQHAERARIHLAQRVGLARRQRVARTGLHVVPPAVIRAGKTHQPLAARVVSRQAHRLHHRLGARHVKRHLVHARDAAQALHVVGHAGVIRAEHRPQRLRTRVAVGDARLVEIDAEHVDAVRTGEVVEGVAVEIGDGDTRGLAHERRNPQMLAQIARVLERHPIGTGELQVGDGGPRGVGDLQRARETALEIILQTLQRGAAPLLHVGGRAVGAEEGRLVVVVARQPGRDATRHARMAGERWVLGQ